MEDPLVFRRAVHSRSSNGVLIMLTVAASRDHRRQSKDPQLRRLSLQFLHNQLHNLESLRLDNYLILTTKRFCTRGLQRRCVHACGWSTLWAGANLTAWDMRSSDMFLMWARQWRYVARTLEMGFDVLRLDTDVHFMRDPFSFLRRVPLDVAMVGQHDFFGRRERPRCTRKADMSGVCGTTTRGDLNIGIVFFRARSLAALTIVDATWRAIDSKLRGVRGRAHRDELIDQVVMRRVIDQRARQKAWDVVPGERWFGRPTPFLTRAWDEHQRVALAPDWLFGRGCLTQARDVHAGAPRSSSLLAELVGVHFVYAASVKRLRFFDAVGWTSPNRSYPACSMRHRFEGHTLLMSHTFADESPTPTTLACGIGACCATIGRIESARFETTDGVPTSHPDHAQQLEGCNDYQLFFD